MGRATNDTILVLQILDKDNALRPAGSLCSLAADVYFLKLHKNHFVF